MRPRLLLAAAAFSLLAAAASASSFGSYDEPPASGIDGMTASSLYLPMRDGVKLAVDIYRPAKGGKPVEGRFPVIWHHTNDRNTALGGAGGSAGAPGLKNVVELTRYGYVVVQVDRRGLGASTGVRRGYHDRNEDFDAYEVTEWLAAQPFSDGKVGIYGCSNTGEAAMHAVTVAPPHLKAAFAGCFSWNKYDGMLRGGIFANWGTGPERSFDQDMQLRPADGSQETLRQAATDHQGNTVLRDLWASMPYRDSFSTAVMSRFWAEGSVSSYRDQLVHSGVPVYIMGGWLDDFRLQGLIAFDNLPEDKRRLVIGPWRHCANDDFNLLAEMHRFFDHYLKDQDNGIEREAPIHYFTVNAPAGQEWRGAAAWPLPGTRDEKLRLEPARFTVNYGVECPAETNGRNGILAMALACPSPLGGPHFRGAPMAADTELTGDPVADIWISADAPDVNLFVYLEDEAPDGNAVTLSDGRLRASLRKVSAAPFRTLGLPWQRGFAEDAEPLVAGKPVRLQFPLLPVSYIVKQGHRLRVSVAGADFRERDRAPRDPAPVINILASTDHPSYVTLPIQPTKTK